MADQTKRCILCERNSNKVPLVSFEYQGRNLQICSQHLPILIHNPAELAGRLPDADKLSPSDHND